MTTTAIIAILSSITALVLAIIIRLTNLKEGDFKPTKWGRIFLIVAVIATALQVLLILSSVQSSIKQNNELLRTIQRENNKITPIDIRMRLLIKAVDYHQDELVEIPEIISADGELDGVKFQVFMKHTDYDATVMIWRGPSWKAYRYHSVFIDFLEPMKFHYLDELSGKTLKLSIDTLRKYHIFDSSKWDFNLDVYLKNSYYTQADDNKFSSFTNFKLIIN